MADRKWPALDLRFSPGPGAGSLQDFLYAELDGFEPLAIQEHESGDGWRVFFRTRSQRNAARAALRAEFRNALTELSPVDVEDEDWARRSQSDLAAVRIGRIVVAPPWDVPAAASVSTIEPRRRPAESHPSNAEGNAASADLRTASREPTPGPDIVIVIEPSMGFGTGHHETTRLCLALLQETDIAGRRVVDVGTGSGVLAIAAALLGAASVLAIDHDADALANARDNIARNSAANVELIEADVSAVHVSPADLVLANLTGAALQRVASSIRRLVTPGGTLLASGFSPDELPDVAAALEYRILHARQEAEWAAAILRPQPHTAGG